MSQKKNLLWLLLTAVCGVVSILYAFNHLAQEPWYGIPELGGDGLKNIYTYLYHAQFDKGIWFQGMNYPYGEHIIFTDGVPLLSVFFANFIHVSPPVALTILWSMICTAAVVSIIFVYLILRHYRLSHLFALVFALLIGLSAPQMLRIQSHYTLSISCVVPMLFYWTILYHESSRKKYLLYIFLLGSVLNFIQPYFTALIFIWSLVYAISYWIFKKDTGANKLRHAGLILLCTIAILAEFAIFMKITDPVTDRPQNPFGALEYTTSRWDIICMDESPFWKYLADRKMVIPWKGRGEGFAYVGLVCMAIFIASSIAGLIRVFKKKKESLVLNENYFSPVWLSLAFLALAFSMGIPFRFHLQWLLDYLSIFRQFRTLGRFSWIFYYVFTVYCVVVLYNWHLKHKGKTWLSWGCLPLFFAITIWCIELNAYLHCTREIGGTRVKRNYDFVFPGNKLNCNAWLATKNWKTSDFQAILPLQMIHVGTEKLWVGEDGNTWVMAVGFATSLQTGLPQVDVFMSRSSWGQARKQLKLAAGPFTEKPMLADCHSKKPFLMMVAGSSLLKVDEQYLVNNADYIGDFYGCRVYALFPDKLLASDKKYRDSAAKIVSVMESADTIVGASKRFFIEHFDNRTARDAYFGNGSFDAKDMKDSTIIEIKVSPDSDQQVYEFSCWFLLNKSNYMSPTLRIGFVDVTNTEIASTLVFTKLSVDNNNLWSRCSKYITLGKNIRKLRVSQLEYQKPEQFICMDEIMLRPASSLVISKSAKGEIMANNHLIKGDKLEKY